MSSLVLVVRHRELKAIYGVWVEKCAGETLPTAASFEPGDLRGWLSHIALVSMARDGAPRYDFFGDGLATAFGLDLTGLTLDSLPDGRRDVLEDDYRRVAETCLPVARVVTDRFNAGDPETWEALLLPLFDDDASVAKVLAAMYPLDR